MLSRKMSLLKLLIIATDGIVRYGTIAVLGGCFFGCGDKPSPQEPKAPVVQPLVVDAKDQVRTFEAKRKQVESLLNKTLTERDELVASLREAGVNKLADLKGNVRGQQLAKSVQQIGVEIEGLERQIIRIDNTILQAKALVRRSEREKVGIAEDEMRKVAEQMKEPEDGMDGVAKAVTPLDVESALQKLLSSQAKFSSQAKSFEIPTAKADKTSSPSLADVIGSPEKYDGQTISFEQVLLSGDFTKGRFLYRLTLKTPAGNVVDGESHPEGITFVMAFAYGDEVKAQLTSGQFTPVRLTCTIKATTGPGKGSDKWIATVSRIEPITASPPLEPIHVPKSEAKVDGLKQVDLWALNTTPAKFDGKTLTVRCSLSGTAFEGTERCRVTVRDTKTTATGDKLRQEGINFVVLNGLKERLLGDLKPDQFYQVQLTITVKQEAKGRWIAVVSEIKREPPLEQVKVISLKEMLAFPATYDGATVAIDRVNISGEINKQQAHPGFHIRIDPGSGNYTYQTNNEWNGFNISSKMANQIKSDVSSGKYMVKLTCKLGKGPGGKWHVEIQQIDFYDKEGASITRSIK